MMFDNEIITAKSLINKNLTYDTNYFKECIIIARYLLTKGNSDNDIINFISDKTKNIYNNFSDDYKFAEIGNIIKIAKRKGALEIPKVIYFSQEEIDEIHSLDNLNAEKLMFLMMCAYKVSEDGNFIFQVKDILKQSNISYNNKYYNSLMYKIIGERKYFEHYIRKNKMKYRPCQYLLDLYNPNNVVLEINDYKNIVYYYLEIISIDKFIRCEFCGCIDIKTSNAKKLCKECSMFSRKEKRHKYYENSIS